jgi:phospholipase C
MTGSKKITRVRRPSKRKAGAGPIAHVVLIIKENHAFDNYFGTFPGANGAPETPAPMTWRIVLIIPSARRHRRMGSLRF